MSKWGLYIAWAYTVLHVVRMIEGEVLLEDHVLENRLGRGRKSLIGYSRCDAIPSRVLAQYFCVLDGFRIRETTAGNAVSLEEEWKGVLIEPPLLRTKNQIAFSPLPLNVEENDGQFQELAR
jgi:hypothetical protein